MPDVFATISGALSGHTTSGLDQAMQDHADKLHPVNSATKIGRSQQGFVRSNVAPVAAAPEPKEAPEKPVMGAVWDK